MICPFSVSGRSPHLGFDEYNLDYLCSHSHRRGDDTSITVGRNATFPANNHRFCQQNRNLFACAAVLHSLHSHRILVDCTSSVSHPAVLEKSYATPTATTQTCPLHSVQHPSPTTEGRGGSVGLGTRLMTEEHKRCSHLLHAP